MWSRNLIAMALLSKHTRLYLYWFHRTNGKMSHDMTKWTKRVCAQQRLRSAWAPSQSDQSLRCALNGQRRTQGFFMRIAKIDQTGWMPRLIWVFAGRTLLLLVLSCRGSNILLINNEIFCQGLQLRDYDKYIYMCPWKPYNLTRISGFAQTSDFSVEHVIRSEWQLVELLTHLMTEPIK